MEALSRIVRFHAAGSAPRDEGWFSWSSLITSGARLRSWRFHPQGALLASPPIPAAAMILARERALARGSGTAGGGSADPLQSEPLLVKPWARARLWLPAPSRQSHRPIPRFGPRIGKLEPQAPRPHAIMRIGAAWPDCTAFNTCSEGSAVDGDTYIYDAVARFTRLLSQPAGHCSSTLSFQPVLFF